jgi:alpha-glucoside transport system permease protein
MTTGYEIFAAASQWQTAAPKLVTLLVGLAVFMVLITLAFFIGERASTRWQGGLRYLVFLGPPLLLIFIGLIAPTIRTLYLSFFSANSSSFVGMENYVWAFTQPEIRIVLRNTMIWVFLAPTGATILGLALAVLTDRMKRPNIVKSLIFMPMAISFVGAGIIWKFVYAYQPNQFSQDIGLLSQITRWLGFTPTNWLLTAPINTLLLIVVMVWVQTGFAMVVLSAAIKAIPEEVLEASLLDGATGWTRFRRVTVPMIRGTIVVVLSTITIATLKVFDIIRTMTGGNFKTSVIANEMYQQSFRALNYGTGSALAVILFLGVLPLVAYNVRTIRKERANV